ITYALADEPRVRTKRRGIYRPRPHGNGLFAGPYNCNVGLFSDSNKPNCPKPPPPPPRPKPPKPKPSFTSTLLGGHNNQWTVSYGTQLLTPDVKPVTTTVTQGQTVSISPTWSTPYKHFTTRVTKGRDNHDITMGLVLNEYFTPTSFHGTTQPYPLPSGLTLNTSNGEITGSIDKGLAPGLYTFALTVRLKTTVRFGGMHTFTQRTSRNSIGITVTYNIYVTSRTSSSTSTTVTQGQQVSVSLPTTLSSYTLTPVGSAGTLPSGLSFANGTITGTPTIAPGTYTYTVTYGTTTTTTGLFLDRSSDQILLTGICNSCHHSLRTGLVKPSPYPIYVATTGIATPIAATYTYVFTVSPSQTPKPPAAKPAPANTQATSSAQPPAQSPGNKPTETTTPDKKPAAPQNAAAYRLPWWWALISGLISLLAPVAIALPLLL
ncbi:putative Ig domain-containing protein, partial [Tropheryma whipplei]|uniref:putative Ig domain-containing protein n=1 Tax=Tropheryma whipplei TaxID=2039 RepID=UPI000570ADB2